MAVRRVEIHVSVMDEDAQKRLDLLFAKLEKLTKGTWTAKFKVDGLDEAKVKIDELNAKLDALDKKTVEPTIKPKFDEDRFRRQMEQADRSILMGFGAQKSALGAHLRAGNAFDRLFNDITGRDAKTGKLPPDRSKGYFRHFLASMTRTAGWGALMGRGFWGGRGAADQTAQGAAGNFSWGGLFGSPVGIGAIGGLLGPVSALIDGLLGFGTGSAVGAGGVGLAAMFKPADFAPGLKNIKQTLSSVAQSIAPSIGMMFANLGKFVQGSAPMLAKLFGSSLPFVQAFFKILEQGAKVILPALTTVMNQFVKSGAMPAMEQAFVILIKGLGEFLVALGPGFKAGAETFRAVAMGIAGILDGLGHVFGWLGQQSGYLYHNIRDDWDKLRHNTAVIFDGMRHEIAHIWDIIWHNTVDAVRNTYHDVRDWFDRLGHDIANLFDTDRHFIASVWDTIWHNTVGTVEHLVTDVVNWFKRLPGEVGTALKNFGTGLYNLGKTALNDMLAGLKAVGGTILGWIKNFFTGIPHTIMSFLHMSPPHPGSAFYDLGANFMHHVQAGMQSRASNIAGAAHGIAANGAAAYARSLANKIGWGGQWGFINDVAMRESGWSMTARNPSSGAYGIAQFINGPGEYYQYGGNPNTVGGQVVAFFNYIRQRYGSPAAAWAHELNFGWYDQGGKLPPGLSLALNTTGHDEIHTTGGGGSGGDTYNIFVLDESYSDAQALRLIQKVKRYKTRHGNKSTGIG